MNDLLQRRVTRGFGIFMIIVYAALGISILMSAVWVELPKAVGVVLLLWAAFRIYMLFRWRARNKNNPDEIRS